MAPADQLARSTMRRSAGLERLMDGNVRYVVGGSPSGTTSSLGARRSSAGRIPLRASQLRRFAHRAGIRLRQRARRRVRLPLRRQLRHSRHSGELRICGRRREDAAPHGTRPRILRRGQGGDLRRRGQGQPSRTLPALVAGIGRAVEAVANRAATCSPTPRAKTSAVMSRCSRQRCRL
jgi:hypothetical protein